MAEINYTKFAGLRNDVSSERFSDGDLEAASNVDLDDTGRISRRPGVIRLLAGAHSLWSDGNVCLFVRGTTLYRLHEDFATISPLRTDMGSERVSYESVNGRVYYSNGTQNGVIDESGRNRTWGIVPPGLPVAENAGGNLAPGDYQYVMTFLRDDGQESGAGLGGVITVTTGGIRFSSLPVSVDPTVSHKAIYLTPQNGDVRYRAAVIANSDTAFTYSGGVLAVPLATQFMQQAPEGSLVRHHFGYMYVVQGGNVFYSQPYGLELFDPRDFLPFDDEVRIFAPVADGIWVGTGSEIFWLDGTDPTKMTASSRAMVGSVKGTLAYTSAESLPDNAVNLPESMVALWWTHEGVCAGYPSGVLKKLTKPRYQPTVVGEKGAGLVRQTNLGIQYVAVVDYN